MSTLKTTLRELMQHDVVVADGFDDAAIGLVDRCAHPPIVIYDFDKAASILVKRDGMTREEAEEYLDFNCVGAWVGEGTPGWMIIRFHKGKVIGD